MILTLGNNFHLIRIINDNIIRLSIQILLKINEKFIINKRLEDI